MRKAVAVLAAGTLATMGFTAPAQSVEPPPHGHMLVLGVEYTAGAPTGFRKCIDLAAGKPVPLNAHHAHMHMGTAGEALEGAGHAVVPTLRIANCAALERMFG